MTFVRTMRPKLDRTYYSLAHLAELLPVPVPQLLASAAEGNLELFVRVPDRHGVFSVHVDGIQPDDPNVLASRRIRNISPLEQEARPFNFGVSGIEGFVLSREDCSKVYLEQLCHQRLFATALRRNGNWIEPQDPVRPNEFHKVKTLDPEGWRVAAYDEQQPILFHSGLGYSKPAAIELSIDRLYATATAIEAFFDIIDTNVFVSEFMEGGELVEELPPYFSSKLTYLLDGSNAFWRTAKPSDSQKFNAIRTRSIDYFSDADFHRLFDAGEAAEGMIDAAARFIVPVYARPKASTDELEASPTRFTPEIKSLMAAAKFFWSSPRIKLDVVSSHPKRDEVEGFLRYMGFAKDDAGLGATLVRLEGAARGAPIKPKVKYRKPFLLSTS